VIFLTIYWLVLKFQNGRKAKPAALPEKRLTTAQPQRRPR
jgi:hypothetical protein